MAVVKGRAIPIQAYAPAPTALLQFRLLRDGEVTAGEKELRLYVDWSDMDVPALIFVGDELTRAQRIALATLQSIEWIAIARDDLPPRRARATYLNLSAGGIYTFDITSGSGGGGGGQPARLAAMALVEKLPASREVVALERVVDGSWRVAGSGITDSSGLADLDLRVTPSGRVYALSVDDFGAPFQANLPVSVGQRIRPSVFGGWLYEITEPGVLPPTEPEWWPAQGDNASRPLGTARAIAVRYYRPLAFGPQPVEVL